MLSLRFLNFLIILLVVLTLATIFGDQSFISLNKLKGELAAAESENLQIKNEVKTLRLSVLQLKTDAATIESVARNNYAYAKDEDLVFFFD